MIPFAEDHRGVPPAAKLVGLLVGDGHERAGGVDHLEPARPSGGDDLGVDAVRAHDDGAALDLGQVVDGRDAPFRETRDDRGVVDQRPQRVDRRGERDPRIFGDAQGALDAVAVARVARDDDLGTLAGRRRPQRDS